MFHEVVDDAGADPSALLEAYERLVREAIEDAGSDRIASETPLDADRATAATNGEASSLTVDEAAAVLAVVDDRDADALVFELRDHLLMGMTTAVIDVDTIAGNIEADLTGQEVQQVLEGRAAMTLAELAEIMGVIEARKP